MHLGRALLPRSTPSTAGVSSRAVGALLDELEARSVECHSLMIVRHGHVLAEGWWAPYSAERPHLLYSLTKTFTAVAVGLVVADGLLSVDDRVVDVLPDHVPVDVSQQARRLTVHHLLSMTTGHRTDSLQEAWDLEPHDLVKGFLRVPFPEPVGTRHAYDNATTFVLARMVERVSGRGLAELLDERLLTPMGIEHAEWDRVSSGETFGFHGLHLTTEAVAAFGELLLRGGRWGDQQLVPREWVELATSQHADTVASQDGSPDDDSRDAGSYDADFGCGYGYQLWRSRHGYHGHGAFGQQCVVVPAYDLVVAVTAAARSQDVFDALWEHLLPGLDDPTSPREDEILADRLRRLSLPPVRGSAGPGRRARASIGARPDDPAPADDSALAPGAVVVVLPVEGGWRVQLGESIQVEVGHEAWRESSPLGRPVVATGAWQGDTFLADLYVITTPHRVRLEVDARTGSAATTWSTVPLTGPDLVMHLRSPLMTRPDVA